MKEWIIRRFKKCGLSVTFDGSENARVSIDGIPNYENDSKQFVEEDFKLRDDVRMRMKMQVKTMKTTNLTFPLTLVVQQCL